MKNIKVFIRKFSLCFEKKNSIYLNRCVLVMSYCNVLLCFAIVSSLVLLLSVLQQGRIQRWFVGVGGWGGGEGRNGGKGGAQSNPILNPVWNEKFIFLGNF